MCSSTDISVIAGLNARRAPRRALFRDVPSFYPVFRTDPPSLFHFPRDLRSDLVFYSPSANATCNVDRTLYRSYAIGCIWFLVHDPGYGRDVFSSVTRLTTLPGVVVIGFRVWEIDFVTWKLCIGYWTLLALQVSILVSLLTICCRRTHLSQVCSNQ